MPVGQLGPRLRAAGVRAGFGFGQPEAGERLAAGQHRQPLLFLFLGAEPVDRHRAEGDPCLQGDRHRLVHRAELFQRQGEREIVAAHAAVLLRERQAEQAHLAHLCHHFVREAVLLVVLGGDRGHHLAGKVADRLRQVLVVLAQGKIRHGHFLRLWAGWS